MNSTDQLEPSNNSDLSKAHITLQDGEYLPLPRNICRASPMNEKPYAKSFWQFSAWAGLKRQLLVMRDALRIVYKRYPEAASKD